MLERKDAIARIVQAWLQRDDGYCVGDGERRQSEEELRECLKAIGATEQELLDAGA